MSGLKLKTPVVVRSPNWLGDAIMAFPAVRNLKNKLGEDRLLVATPEKLKALWELAPFVDQVVVLEHAKRVWPTARTIRALKPGAVVLLPNSLRSAVEAAVAGLRQIVGYNTDWRRWFLSHPIDVADYQPARAHQKYFYLDLVNALGAPGPDDFPPLKRSWSGGAKGPVCVCPGAEYGPAKRWPVERFAEVARALAAEGHAILVLGGPNDARVAGEVAGLVPGSRNLAGQTTLGELVDHMTQAALVLSNDSGAMHLASVLGTPTVAIFGSTEPRRTAPLGPRTTWLREHVPCSPCFLRECPLDFACMQQVTVEMVLAVSRERLAVNRS